MAQYGGKRIAGGTKIEVADGTWCPARMVVLEFESLAKAKAWYNSPEYQAARAFRLGGAGENELVIVDGADAPPK